MADDQKQLGLLKEYSVYLLNADGTRSVGITRLIRQMSITEDIFKNTLYGSVRIKDAVDLLETGFFFAFVAHDADPLCAKRE